MLLIKLPFEINLLFRFHFELIVHNRRKKLRESSTDCFSLSELPGSNCSITFQSDQIVRDSELVELDASDVKARAETLYRDLVQTAVREAEGE